MVHLVLEIWRYIAKLMLSLLKTSILTKIFICILVVLGNYKYYHVTLTGANFVETCHFSQYISLCILLSFHIWIWIFHNIMTTVVLTIYVKWTHIYVPFFIIRPFEKLDVLCRGNIRPSVRPSVRVFRTFLQHALRYQFETWYIHSVGGTTCRVWVASQLGHFDLVYSQK